MHFNLSKVLAITLAASTSLVECSPADASAANAVERRHVGSLAALARRMVHAVEARAPAEVLVAREPAPMPHHQGMTGEAGAGGGNGAGNGGGNGGGNGQGNGQGNGGAQGGANAQNQAAGGQNACNDLAARSPEPMPHHQGMTGAADASAGNGAGNGGGNGGTNGGANAQAQCNGAQAGNNAAAGNDAAAADTAAGDNAAGNDATGNAGAGNNAGANNGAATGSAGGTKANCKRHHQGMTGAACDD